MANFAYKIKRTRISDQFQFSLLLNCCYLFQVFAYQYTQGANE